MMTDSTTAPEQAQAHLEAFIQDYFSEKKKSFDYGEWFDPLYFDLCEYVGRKGKRIRPLMLMQSYKAFGGEKSFTDPSLLRCAMALELLHTFVLIHDDVIDQSEKRRGLPTFHKVAAQRIDSISDQGRIGENVAMVMGDVVFAMAINTLNESEFALPIREQLLALFLQYATDTGSGEIYDILLGAKDVSRVSIGEIEKMYHLKTTRYTFEAPCVLGGILAGASPEKIKQLCILSEPLGLAFQIQNDLLEFKSIDRLGPMVSADLLEGKKTYLLRKAFENLNEVEQSFLQMCLSSGNKKESTMFKLQELINKSGAIELAETYIDSLFQKVDDVFDSGVFSTEEVSQLKKGVEMVRQQVRLS